MSSQVKTEIYEPTYEYGGESYEYNPETGEFEQMSQGFKHYAAITYLITVLSWYYQSLQVGSIGVASGINFYLPPGKRPLCPDVFAVDGLVIEDRTDDSNSYFIGPDGPAPRLTIEVSSGGNWPNDLQDKPARYAQMGVRHYIVFDPNEPTVWRGHWATNERLVAWELDAATGQYRQLPKDPDGRIWSEELQSWLKVEGQFLRLYTSDGQLRLTETEGAVASKDQEIARLQALLNQRDQG